MNNITNEASTRIIACYPNALIKLSDFDARQIGISYDQNELILRAVGGMITDSFIAPVKDCKLLLTSLSAITDEHLKEIAEMHGCTWAKMAGNFLQIAKYDGMVECYYILTGRLPIFLIDYLRSKSYNCGYGSYRPEDLITLGVAIDKTAL